MKLFQVNGGQIRLWREIWSQAMCERAKQSTRKPPKVPGAENGNMFKFAECGEKRQKKLSVFRAKMWHLNKTEEKACTPSMVLMTGPYQDERGTVCFRLWKNLCAPTEGVYWEADWKWCTFFLLHSSLNNLLIFKIYMQRRKRYPFWNNRPIKPIFCNYINSFFKTRLVSLSHVMLRRHLQISTG